MTDIEFKRYLWEAANKLRGSVDAAEYKYPVLGLVFLKYVSDIFEAQAEKIKDELRENVPEDMLDEIFADMVNDRDSYTKDNVFWIPEQARYKNLHAKASQPNLDELLDNAIRAIEEENPKLNGVLFRDFVRLPLPAGRLGELMDVIAKMEFSSERHGSRDVFGEVYEYLLGQFAISEGQRAGQFYTANTIVKTLVEVLAPFNGRIYDPACGSGGMFVQSERFIEAHGGKRGQVAIYGQEMSASTRKLACMNLAIRGIDYDLGTSYGDTFHDDQHPDLKADYVLANPPFNVSDWGGDKLASDPRWVYGTPPAGNANYAWLQHIKARLSSKGRAGVVLANGSLSSTSGGEDDIRKAMIKDGFVECIVALPGQLFTNTQIPACLWFLSNDKGAGRNGNIDRSNEVLFIDARKMASLLPDSRTQKEFSGDEIAKIANAYHAWRGTQWANGEYEDELGFCKSATHEEIEKHVFVLTPARYVGSDYEEMDDETYEEKMTYLTALLSKQLKESKKLDFAIQNCLEGVGYEL